MSVKMNHAIHNLALEISDQRNLRLSVVDQPIFGQPHLG